MINKTEYNTFGQKITQIADYGTGAINQTTEWGYDRAGRQTEITGYVDENNPQVHQTTVYDYDKLGNVKKITYPDSATIQYAYNSVGKVWRRIDQRQLRTYYVYDAAGGLSAKTDDPASGGDPDPNLYDPNTYNPNRCFIEAFTYDGLGRQLTAEKTIDGNDISASVFLYNDIGMLTNEAQTLFGGTQRTVSYGYDQFGYRTSTIYPDGSTTITRTNSWQGQIDTLSQSSTELVAYDYLGSRMVRRAYNTTTPVNADYGYDRLGRITGIDAGTGLIEFTYTYETDENNIDKKYFHHRGSTVYNQYDYDDIDRVTRADYLVNELTNVYEAFTMDDLGNRDGSQTLRDGSSDTYTVDTTTNRYNSIDSANLDYDVAGNLTEDKDGYQFTYDYENRITKIEDDQQTLIAEFDYDTQGRRIRVYDAIAQTTTLYYYSDNWQVLSEYDNANNLQAYYIFGNYIDEVLLMHRNSADKFYLHDHLYSPAALLSDAGSVVERYEYDAYGDVHIMDTSFNARTSSSYGNPYYLAGRERDTLNSGNLNKYHLRYRDLDSYMGVFYQKDPLGITPNAGLTNPIRTQNEYMGGLNLYAYVYSRPILSVDPYGLWGTFVHLQRTRVWAQYVDYPYEAASAVAAADEAVDSGSTGPFPWQDQSYHFNRNLSGGEDTRLVHLREHYWRAELYCHRAIDMPEEAAKELGTALHPLQDWVAHADYAMKNDGKVYLPHNYDSPQKEYGASWEYPDDPTLDVVGSPDGRATRNFIVDELIGWEGKTKKIYSDFAYYEKGTKRYDLTRGLTLEELKGYRWYVKTQGGCKCKKYFGVK